MHNLEGFRERAEKEIKRSPDSITFAFDPESASDREAIDGIVNDVSKQCSGSSSPTLFFEARNPIDPNKITTSELEAIFNDFQRYNATINHFDKSLRHDQAAGSKERCFRIKAGDVVRPLYSSELPYGIEWLDEFLADNQHVQMDGILFGEFLFLVREWFKVEKLQPINFSGACSEDALEYEVDHRDPVKTVLSVLNRPSLDIFDPRRLYPDKRRSLINGLWRDDADLVVPFDGFSRGYNRKLRPPDGRDEQGVVLLWTTSKKMKVEGKPQLVEMDPPVLAQIQPCLYSKHGRGLVISTYANRDGSDTSSPGLFTINDRGEPEMPIDFDRLEVRSKMPFMSAQLVGIRPKVRL